MSNFFLVKVNIPAKLIFSNLVVLRSVKSKGELEKKN